MLPVQRIPLILLLVLLTAACGSSSDLDHLPLIAPEPPAVQDPEGVEPAHPSGYIADPETKYFHRMDCPDAREVKPSIRQFFVTPFDALNAGYAPCEYCEPMSGWK